VVKRRAGWIDQLSPIDPIKVIHRVVVPVFTGGLPAKSARDAILNDFDIDIEPVNNRIVRCAFLLESIRRGNINGV